MASTPLSIPDSLSLAPSQKRKCNDPEPPTPPSSSPPNSQIRINTNIVSNLDESNGLGSPRTKVANNFQCLQINDSVRSKLDLGQNIPAITAGTMDIDADGDKSGVRKRIKVLEIPETPNIRISKITAPAEKETESKARAFAVSDGEKQVELHNEVDPVIFKSGNPLGKVKSGALARAYPSINRLSDSKSRARNRTSTPPLSSSASTSMDESKILYTIIDPERAALAWHDDEITGHDPTDPDDDGEGINGIGFKPTPAEAYARAEKRKIQMAKYKHREAKEARARRSERRRGTDRMEREEQKDRERRVRFLEAEKIGAITSVRDTGL